MLSSRLGCQAYRGFGWSSLRSWSQLGCSRSMQNLQAASAWDCHTHRMLVKQCMLVHHD